MKLKERIHRFLHDEKLKRKLYVIIFESDTPAGKLFDVILIACILVSVLLVIIESLKGLPTYLTTPFVIMEFLFTGFFTFEYLTRIYCSPRPRKYIFSFFGIVDLLATLPLYIGLLFPGARYLLIIRAFRLIRLFRVILVTSIGTLMYMIEGTQPNSQFNNIPNSIYWAIVTMTTVGYGDITPATGLGKFLSACVMLIGYTIIAVPTGIVSASMMKEYKRRRDKECPNCHRSGHEDNAEFCKYCGHSLAPSETKAEEK